MSIPSFSRRGLVLTGASAALTAASGLRLPTQAAGLAPTS